MKRYIAALMAAIMLLTMCCSCGDDKENPEVGGETNRFVRVETIEASSFIGENWCIWVDTETGVLYARVYSGVTVLLDADGKPLLYEEG